jgi:predicted Zn-dependent protease
MVKQEKKLQKTFTGEFDRLLKKLQEKENFAFARFSDGEIFMLRGQKLVLAENSFITGEKRGIGRYPKEEQKSFDPEKDKFYQDKLIEALQYRKKNYFKGLTGIVDEDIAGKGSFQFQLDLYGKGDDEHLSFANVFINANYKRFIEEAMVEIKKRPIVFICNEAADLSNLAFSVEKDFRVGSNCIINDYELVEEIKGWIRDNGIKDHIFLCSASTLSNYIIYECFKEFDENTYLDIGSSLSPWLNLEGWRYTRAYLQHWILGMPNKYGVQEDKWN